MFCVGYGIYTREVIQCFVLIMEYIRGSRAPECIFHNKHITLYYLFSPDPAVSCVCFTPLSVHIM